MSTLKQWKSLTLQLNKIFNGFPTMAERAEMTDAIKKLKLVLDDLELSILSLPTTTEAEKAKESLAKLQNIIENNPLLRAQKEDHTPRKTLSNSRNVRRTSDFVVVDIAGILNRLNSLTESDLRNELETSEKISNQVLRKLLSHLGRKVPSKNTRRDMIEQLIVTIINRRTYEGLRGDKDVPNSSLKLQNWNRQ